MVGSVSYMLALPAAPALIGRFGALAIQRFALVFGTAAMIGLSAVEFPALLRSVP